MENSQPPQQESEVISKKQELCEKPGATEESREKEEHRDRKPRVFV